MEWVLKVAMKKYKSIKQHQKDIIAAVGRVRSAGLKAYAGFIIGFPEDTIETVWDTIRFPDELNIDSPGFQLMVLILLQQFEKS